MPINDTSFPAMLLRGAHEKTKELISELNLKLVVLLSLLPAVKKRCEQCGVYSH